MELILKKINFDNVTMENFCGYQDKMEFTFENNKLILISGPNGVGKTTVFSAIPFACFGVTQSGQKSGDVVNNKTGKNCKVTCNFTITEDDIINQYNVERYVKYTKIGSTAILYKNGEEIARGFSEVTAKLEHILVPKELFFNTILFGQNVKNFFTDLPDSKQKEIFRKILQLDMYTIYKETATAKLRQLESTLEQGKYDLIQLDSNRQIHKDQIVKENNDIGLFKDNIIEYDKSIITIQIIIDKIKKAIELSETRYCGVSEMLRKSSKLITIIYINGEEI